MTMIEPPAYLTTRICKVLQEHNRAMYAREVCVIVGADVRDVAQAMSNLRSVGNLSAVRNAAGVPSFTLVRMPNPPTRPKKGTQKAKPLRTGTKRTDSSSGVIAGPRQPPDMSRTLKRNPFEAMQLAMLAR